MFTLRGWRVAMWLRRLGFSRNPMRRLSDRIESAVFTMVLVAAVVAVPIGYHVGQVAFEEQTQTSVERATRTHETMAVLLEGAPDARVTPGDQQGTVTKPSVLAQWQAPDGSRHTGMVEAEFGAATGEEVPVWTDRNGTLTDAPATPLQIRARATALGLVAGFGWLLALAIAQLLFRWALDRRRLARWGEEWETVERVWRRQKP